MSSTPSPDFPPRPDRVRDVAPMLHWLLEMLVCLHAGEGLDVLLRPGGDRRREIKLHLPACDRQVLERLLELLRGMGGAVVEEGENPGLGPEVGGRGQESEGRQEFRSEFVAESDAKPDSGFEPGAVSTTVSSSDASHASDESELYTLEVDILRVLRAAGRPLLGKVVAARLGRKYTGWLKTCLARLVRLGCVRQGTDGYWVEGSTDLRSDQQRLSDQE